MAPRGRARAKLTNLEKVFWPGEGYTKGDLIAYYDAVAPWLLPVSRGTGRSCSRATRTASTGKSFFQKDAPESTPSWVRTEPFFSRGHRTRHRATSFWTTREPLRYVANLGTIPLHVWSARVAALDRPTGS